MLLHRATAVIVVAEKNSSQKFLTNCWKGLIWQNSRSINSKSNDRLQHLHCSLLYMSKKEECEKPHKLWRLWCRWAATHVADYRAWHDFKCLSVLNLSECTGQDLHQSVQLSHKHMLQFIWWWQPWILLEKVKPMDHLGALSVLLRAA